MNKLFAFVALVLTCMSVPVHAREHHPLIVDVSETESCVMKNTNGDLIGFDIDLWRGIAGELKLKEGVDYEFRFVSFTDLFSRVSSHQSDLGISCISPTAERLDQHQIDFTLPYVEDTGIGVLIKKVELSRWEWIWYSGIIEEALFFVGMLLAYLIICALLQWILDFKGGDLADDFSGIEQAAWGLFAVMSTVGWGDVLYKLRKNRIFVFFFWVLATFLLTVLAGNLLRQMQENNEELGMWKMEDLRGKKVATIADTTSVQFVNQIGAQNTVVENLDQALNKLQSGAIDGIVFDRFPMQYAANQRGDKSLVMLSGTMNRDYYSIALHRDHPLRGQIDRAILQMRQDGRIRHLILRWYGI